MDDRAAPDPVRTQIRPLTRLGMLTPSSNTVLEPVVCRMAASLPDVSLHFSRFPVTEISLAPRALGQFDDEPMLGAAALLADAHMASICWNGTSAAWLGLGRDRALCASIEARTGIPATSAVLALDALLRRKGIGRIGLVTPYIDAVQERILATFRSEGYSCVAERHRGISVNHDFALIEPSEVGAMVRDVARARPDAIVVLCTNMWGGPLADALEAELGLPLLDTVATALWGALDQAGVPPRRVTGFGQLFGW